MKQAPLVNAKLTKLENLINKKDEKEFIPLDGGHCFGGHSYRVRIVWR